MEIYNLSVKELKKKLRTMVKAKSPKAEIEIVSNRINELTQLTID